MSGLIPPALLFPYLVREPSETNTNCTDPANKDLVQDIKTDVSYILYTEAAITSLVNTLKSKYVYNVSNVSNSERYVIYRGDKGIFSVTVDGWVSCGGGGGMPVTMQMSFSPTNILSSCL